MGIRLELSARHFPLAYAYHRLIFDEAGKAVDFVFLDVNSAYEKLTGLSAESLLGKKASEVFPEIREDPFDWIDSYAQVVRSGKTGEFTQYVEKSKRWYRITAFCPEAGHFACLFQDVTAKMENLLLLEKQQQEIRALNRNLAMVFEHSPEALFLAEVQAENFRYLCANTAYKTITGMDDAAINGKTPLEAFGPATGSRLLKNYRRAAAKKSSIAYEEKIRFPASDVTHWYCRLVPILENGTAKHLMGSRTDITRLKTLTDEKKHLLRCFRSIFDDHSAMFIILDPKTNRLIRMNPAACKFFGYSAQEAQGLPVNKLSTLPEEPLRAHIRQAMKQEIAEFMTGCRKRNGELRQLEVFASPIDYDGKLCLCEVAFDVTDQESCRKALQNERNLLRVTLDSIADGVITTDCGGHILSLNHAAHQMTGWAEAEATGRPFSEIFLLQHGNSEGREPGLVEQVLKSGKETDSADYTILLPRKSTEIPVNASAAPIRDGSGNLYGAVLVFRDISREKDRERQIHYLSFHDRLTGLYNRHFLEAEMTRLNTPRQLPLSLMVGDMNGLKLTNDIFGHMEGDRLLIKTAEIIRECCRAEDIIARLGGDEILILLPQTPLSEAERLAERIRGRLLENSDGLMQMSMSFGCAEKRTPEEDFDEIIKRADQRMYHQKLMEGKRHREEVMALLPSLLQNKIADMDGHTRRLREHCRRMSFALGLSVKDSRELIALAEMHDIGKVGLPCELLNKKPPLTDEEMQEIREHAVIGYRIAQGSPELAPIAEYILCHHERWDGGGYPRGIAGENIPLVVRIFSVADFYDSIRNGLEYYPNADEQEAAAGVRANAGKRFDPAMAALFLSILP